MTSNNSDDIKKINTIPTTTTNKYDSIGVQENIKNINL
jgi:hypothetical protein